MLDVSRVPLKAGMNRRCKRTFVRTIRSVDVAVPTPELETTQKLLSGICPVCGSKDVSSKLAIPVVDHLLSLFNK